MAGFCKYKKKIFKFHTTKDDLLGDQCLSRNTSLDVTYRQKHCVSETETEAERTETDYVDITTLTVKQSSVPPCELTSYTFSTEWSCSLIFKETEVGWESGRSTGCSNNERREYSWYSNTFCIKTGSAYLITHIYGRKVHSSYVYRKMNFSSHGSKLASRLRFHVYTHVQQLEHI